MTDIDDIGEPYELSKNEAALLLGNFLKNGQEAFDSSSLKAATADLHLDNRENSVVAFIRIAMPKLSFHGQPDDPTLDRDGSVWLARAAYYFGQSLVTASARLKWSIGAEGTVFQNMPVVTGFKAGVEASVVSIIKNMAMRVHLDGDDFASTERAVGFWFDAASKLSE